RPCHGRAVRRRAACGASSPRPTQRPDRTARRARARRGPPLRLVRVGAPARGLTPRRSPALACVKRVFTFLVSLHSCALLSFLTTRSFLAPFGDSRHVALAPSAGRGGRAPVGSRAARAGPGPLRTRSRRTLGPVHRAG